LLLTYKKLRHKLHIDVAKACCRNAKAGFALTEEQHALLSAFSSEAEYHVNSGRRADMEGRFVVGPFELLTLELDVVSRVREAIVRVVSLCPEGEEEDDEGTERD
jgi:hypothetical protein